MNDRGKTLLSVSTLALLILTMTCDAYADTNRDQRRTIKQVRSCVAEIAKHANYDDTSRALHWVERLSQKNHAELEISIETTVYSIDGEVVARKYKTSCLTAGMGILRKFRIHPVELDTDRQN